jgi:hypothetical protein
MEGITQRKVTPQRTLDNDNSQSETTKIQPASNLGPQFLYGDLLLGSLIPPFLVLLAFGGRPALLTICFGSIFAYIFDIVGAMEV